MHRRQEIGSEFWDVPTTDTDNGLFPDNTNWFISGRSALTAIIEDIKKETQISSVSLPDWCCETMIIPFLKAGIMVEFYQALKPIEKVSTDAILVMDYFGYTGHGTVEDYDGIVIRDLTHSILSKDYDDADYYYGSMRKWAGFWTGGYAWGFKNAVKYDNVGDEYSTLREKAMLEKLHYLEGDNDSKIYLDTFSKAEALLDKYDIVPAHQRDIDLAKKMDITFVKSRRRENAKLMLNELSDTAIFPNLAETDCPLFVPIRVKNRDELRRYLIQNEIYCPIHWGATKYHNLGKNTEEIIEEELSLVCDQRYDAEDMHRMIELIKRFEGRTKC